MNRPLATLLLATLPGLCLLVSGSDKTMESEKEIPLTTFQKGELPIILSAPHGGRFVVPGVKARKGEGIARFARKSDAGTDKLTQQLADEIEKRTGKRPYVVIATFHRKFIDANRPPKLAYESEKAKPTYDAYHEALANARREVSARWGSGIILDIHGQAAELDTIIRGTQNGRTIAHLMERFGRESLVGETSLFGELSRKGFKIFPMVDSQKKEHPKYNGGHIVSTYGSLKGGLIDAIQLELGRNLRLPEATAETARKLATAIGDFSKTHLPTLEKSAK